MKARLLQPCCQGHTSQVVSFSIALPIHNASRRPLNHGNTNRHSRYIFIDSRAICLIFGAMRVVAGWSMASCQIRKLSGCACAGNIFPATAGKTFPAFSAHAWPAIFCIWQEARGPWTHGLASLTVMVLQTAIGSKISHWFKMVIHDIKTFGMAQNKYLWLIDFTQSFLWI